MRNSFADSTTHYSSIPKPTLLGPYLSWERSVLMGRYINTLSGAQEKTKSASIEARGGWNVLNNLPEQCVRTRKRYQAGTFSES